MLYLAGIIIAFFLSLLLLGKKNKNTPDKILAAWLLTLGIHLSFVYLYAAGNYLDYPYLLGLHIPLPLLHGPFLYLYTASLTNKHFNTTYKLLHFLPAVVSYIFFFPFYISSAESKIFVYQHEGIGYQLAITIMLVAIIISGIVYVILSLLLLREHRKNIAGQFSYLERVNLNWLRYLVLGIGLIWLAVIFGGDDLIFSLVVLFIIFLGYFGIKQVGIFTEQRNVKRDENPEMVSPGQLPAVESILPPAEENEYIKYQKSGISDTQVNNIHQQLGQLMQQEKLFTNAELTLAELSQKLNVHPNTLSQVINSIEKKNFYDYINSQRIEEFKRIVTLPENQQYTILSLAFECGFNSKTSFNRNFKKATGLSPTDYLKNQHINLS